MDHKSRLTTLAEIAGIVGTILALVAFASQMGWLNFFNATPTQVASAATPTVLATLAPTSTIAPTLAPLPTDTVRPTPSPSPEPSNTPRPSATLAPKPTDVPTATATATATPTSTPRPTITPTATPTPGIGATRVAAVDGAMMMYVPAGEFAMGSNDNDNEKPIHPVSLDAFWMDKFEVSNALYKKCVDAGKCTKPSEIKSFTRDVYYGDPQFDNFPVIYVSWNDANAYCAWAGKRLPTEAEWEKAARGPANPNGRQVFPWGNAFDKNRVNAAEGGKGDTVAVDAFIAGASGYGMFNMAGNVWEWVNDWYDPRYYYSLQPNNLNNPKGPNDGRLRVLRGGTWNSDQSNIRISLRFAYSPNAGSYQVGFRCVQ